MKRIVTILFICALAVTARANWRGAFDDAYFAQAVAAGAKAAGGTITDDGTYWIHSFTNVGTSTFTVISGSLSCDVVVVAGGGGGVTWISGGGGGGGVIITNTSWSGVNSVIVGLGGGVKRGGDSAEGPGTNGGNSSISSLVAYGGGCAGSEWNFKYNASPGGCGGGGGHTGLGGAGTNGQGYAGGDGYGSPPYTGAGGGGAGTVGTNGTSVAGNGGQGKPSDISGVTKYYGGGGGGCSYQSADHGSGSIGGGGWGNYGADGGDGTNGHGGGGGAWASGGSGIVIVRYLK